jgi:hypothetical protein
LSNYSPYSRPHARSFARHCSCRSVLKRTWNSEPQRLIYRAS